MVCAGSKMNEQWWQSWYVRTSAGFLWAWPHCGHLGGNQTFENAGSLCASVFPNILSEFWRLRNDASADYSRRGRGGAATRLHGMFTSRPRRRESSPRTIRVAAAARPRRVASDGSASFVEGRSARPTYMSRPLSSYSENSPALPMISYSTVNDLARPAHGSPNRRVRSSPRRTQQWRPPLRCTLAWSASVTSNAPRPLTTPRGWP
mmetsp:Transcript_33235/g.100168  ORF Transcript_33235/g.100168 Transcript_33235/m.100168 type:complete len:206 (+) Transcript_33235:286-903(+)